MTVLYVILGVLALGFLVFIHELGHYWMAKRVGMRVEVFSIGMGASIVKWYRKGVKWQIGWIPFGGYVKIAGMEKEGGKEPYEIPDGFFGKSPKDRIKVAIMGPLVNIVFAFLAFFAIWMLGGREKPFSDFTSRVGWVDPYSEIYKKGVRPGDVITSYDGYDVKKSRDHLYAPMLGGDKVKVEGYFRQHTDPAADQPFLFEVTPYVDQDAVEDGIKTLGVSLPASYLLIQDDPSKLKGPAGLSHLKKGDRILWVNGDFVFSNQQLRKLINSSHALVTYKRGDKKGVAKIPLYQLDEFRLSDKQRGELIDWKHADDEKVDFNQAWFVPYDLSPDGTVEGALNLLGTYKDPAAERIQLPVGNLLIPGDEITSINGVPVATGPEIFHELQLKKAVVISASDAIYATREPWYESEEKFDKIYSDPHLIAAIESIGNGESVQKGSIRLEKPMLPLRQLEFNMTPEERAALEAEYKKIGGEIEKMPAGDAKRSAEKWFHQWKNERVLGVQIADHTIQYNPSPNHLFGDVLEETWRTLSALVEGSLHPKWMSGPVGIVRVMQHGWSLGLSEALFWMAVISLNLGILNLLPIPVLDGGHICFSIWEMMTKKPLKARTMELLIIPFVALLIGFFIFVTYNDIARLLGF